MKKSLVYINLWHINHFLSGVFFALLHLYFYRFESPFMTYFVVHTLWELWQLFIGMTIPNLRGILDIGNDTLFGLLGVFLVLRLKGK